MDAYVRAASLSDEEPMFERGTLKVRLTANHRRLKRMPTDATLHEGRETLLRGFSQRTVTQRSEFERDASRLVGPTSCTS